MISTRNLTGLVVRRLFGRVARNGRATTNAVASLLALTAAIFLLIALLGLPSQIKADNDQVRTIVVDVSTGFPYSQNNVDPAKGQEVFFPGDTFIQDGSIFPAGRILAGSKDFDPNSPGAIGHYRVRGTFLTDFLNFQRASAHDHTAAPEMAFATEMFSFMYDKSIILTDGTWPNAYFSADRVVLGGTGIFRDVIGEVSEENIGENKYGFCNLRVTLKVHTAK